MIDAQGVIRDRDVRGEAMDRAGDAPLAAAPRWLGADFAAVDRVEVAARPAVDDAGWYALDDLTFTVDGSRRVLDFEDLPWRAQVTGSGYGGLTWEAGARRGAGSAGGQRVGAVDAPGDARSAVAVEGYAAGGAEALITVARSPHVDARGVRASRRPRGSVR